MKKIKMQRIKKGLIGGSLLIAMCLMLTGCGNQDNNGNDPNSIDKTATQPDNQAGGPPPDDMGAGGPPPDDGGGAGMDAPMN